jgi:hypothetical protein
VRHRQPKKNLKAGILWQAAVSVASKEQKPILHRSKRRILLIRLAFVKSARPAPKQSAYRLLWRGIRLAGRQRQSRPADGASVWHGGQALT